MYVCIGMSYIYIYCIYTYTINGLNTDQFAWLVDAQDKQTRVSPPGSDLYCIQLLTPENLDSQDKQEHFC